MACGNSGIIKILSARLTQTEDVKLEGAWRVDTVNITPLKLLSYTYMITLLTP